MKTKKICVIEDEPLISHAIQMSELGDFFELIAGSDGEEGLELVRTERPDLVLTDLLMPKMDGFQMIEAIRADDDIKDTKIIVMSNDATEESKKKVFSLGVIDYIIKADLDLSELAKRIPKLLK